MIKISNDRFSLSIDNEGFNGIQELMTLQAHLSIGNIKQLIKIPLGGDHLISDGIILSPEAESYPIEVLAASETELHVKVSKLTQNSYFFPDGCEYFQVLIAPALPVELDLPIDHLLAKKEIGLERALKLARINKLDRLYQKYFGEVL